MSFWLIVKLIFWLFGFDGFVFNCQCQLYRLFSVCISLFASRAPLSSYHPIILPTYPHPFVLQLGLFRRSAVDGVVKVLISCSLAQKMRPADKIIYTPTSVAIKLQRENLNFRVRNRRWLSWPPSCILAKFMAGCAGPGKCRCQRMGPQRNFARQYFLNLMSCITSNLKRGKLCHPHPHLVAAATWCKLIYDKVSARESLRRRK